MTSNGDQPQQPAVKIPEGATAVYTTEGPPHKVCGYYSATRNASPNGQYLGLIHVYAVDGDNQNPQAVAAIDAKSRGAIVRIYDKNKPEGHESIRTRITFRTGDETGATEQSVAYRMSRIITENLGKSNSEEIQTMFNNLANQVGAPTHNGTHSPFNV